MDIKQAANIVYAGYYLKQTTQNCGNCANEKEDIGKCWSCGIKYGKPYSNWREVRSER
jgi:hypothetical protein